MSDAAVHADDGEGDSGLAAGSTAPLRPPDASLMGQVADRLLLPPAAPVQLAGLLGFSRRWLAARLLPPVTLLDRLLARLLGPAHAPGLWPGAGSSWIAAAFPHFTMPLRQRRTGRGRDRFDSPVEADWWPASGAGASVEPWSGATAATREREGTWAGAPFAPMAHLHTPAAAGADGALGGAPALPAALSSAAAQLGLATPLLPVGRPGLPAWVQPALRPAMGLIPPSGLPGDAQLYPPIALRLAAPAAPVTDTDAPRPDASSKWSRHGAAGIAALGPRPPASPATTAARPDLLAPSPVAWRGPLPTIGMGATAGGSALFATASRPSLLPTTAWPAALGPRKAVRPPAAGEASGSPAAGAPFGPALPLIVRVMPAVAPRGAGTLTGEEPAATPASRPAALAPDGWAPTAPSLPATNIGGPPAGLRSPLAWLPGSTPLKPGGSGSTPPALIALPHRLTAPTTLTTPALTIDLASSLPALPLVSHAANPAGVWHADAALPTGARLPEMQYPTPALPANRAFRQSALPAGGRATDAPQLSAHAGLMPPSLLPTAPAPAAITAAKPAVVPAVFARRSPTISKPELLAHTYPAPAGRLPASAAFLSGALLSSETAPVGVSDGLLPPVPDMPLPSPVSEPAPADAPDQSWPTVPELPTPPAGASGPFSPAAARFAPIALPMATFATVAASVIRSPGRGGVAEAVTGQAPFPGLRRRTPAGTSAPDFVGRDVAAIGTVDHWAAAFPPRPPAEQAGGWRPPWDELPTADPWTGRTPPLRRPGETTINEEDWLAGALDGRIVGTTRTVLSRRPHQGITGQDDGDPVAAIWGRAPSVAGGGAWSPAPLALSRGDRGGSGEGAPALARAETGRHLQRDAQDEAHTIPEEDAHEQQPEEPEAAAGQRSGGAELEQMAREVYALLRRRLTIEQERRRGM